MPGLCVGRGLPFSWVRCATLATLEVAPAFLASLSARQEKLGAYEPYRRLGDPPSLSLGAVPAFLGSLRSRIVSVFGDPPSLSLGAVLRFRKFASLPNENGDGRRERIRTSGPYVPNVVLYQAELLSDKPNGLSGLSRGSALIAMPPGPRNQPKVREFPADGGVFFGIFAALKACHPLYMVPGLTTALGRRQVVRHWILIPAFEGSIPSAPANQSLLCGEYPNGRNLRRLSGRLGQTGFRQSITSDYSRPENRRLCRPVSGP